MQANQPESFSDPGSFPVFFEKLMKRLSPTGLVHTSLANCANSKDPLSLETMVVAIGKASEAMVAGLLETQVPAMDGQNSQSSTGGTCFADIPVERILVVSPDSVKKNLPPKVPWLQGNHPFPSKESFAAGRYLMDFVRSGKPGQRLLGLMSGGASALACFSCAGLAESEKTTVHELLVGSGRSIHDINLVRRHLSEFKGGGLLRIALEQGMDVSVLALSDVSGDFPHDIGSGPLAPDPTTFQQAFEIARAIPGFPGKALQILSEGVRGERRETLKPHELIPNSWSFEVLANRASLLESAKELIVEGGFDVEILPKNISGNPRHCASALLDWIMAWRSSNGSDPHDRGNERPAKAPLASGWHGSRGPLAFLAAGEAEVQLPAHQSVGKGGRACVLLLELAILAFERGQVLNLSVAATDGVDGNSDTAGGFLLAGDFSPERVKEMQTALDTFDSGSFLRSRGRSFPSGITGTNLGDLVIISPGIARGKAFARAANNTNSHD